MEVLGFLELLLASKILRQIPHGRQRLQVLRTQLLFTPLQHPTEEILSFVRLSQALPQRRQGGCCCQRLGVVRIQLLVAFQCTLVELLSLLDVPCIFQHRSQCAAGSKGLQVLRLQLLTLA